MSAEPNYRRAKPGKKTFQNNPANGVVGPTSQIPGLSQSADDAPAQERTSGRRVGIFESDSDYIKLAKQGGHRGLLSHDDVDEGGKKTSPSYQPPDWYNANSGSRSPVSPSQTSSADSTSSRKSPTKGAARPLAPFGTDDVSPWDQEANAFTAGKDKAMQVGNAASEMEKMTIHDPKEIGKYKKISHDKKAAKETVSMSKLLSFGYMEENEKKSVDDDASSMTSEQTSTIAPDDDLE